MPLLYLHSLWVWWVEWPSGVHQDMCRWQLEVGDGSLTPSVWYLHLIPTYPTILVCESLCTILYMCERVATLCMKFSLKAHTHLLCSVAGDQLENKVYVRGHAVYCGVFYLLRKCAFLYCCGCGRLRFWARSLQLEQVIVMANKHQQLVTMHTNLIQLKETALIDWLFNTQTRESPNE